MRGWVSNEGVAGWGEGVRWGKWRGEEMVKKEHDDDDDEEEEEEKKEEGEEET